MLKMKQLLLFLLFGVQLGYSQSWDLNNVHWLIEDEYTLKYQYGNTKVRVMATGYSSNEEEKLKDFLKKQWNSEIKTDPNLNFSHFYVSNIDTLANDLYQSNVSYFIDLDGDFFGITIMNLDRRPKTKLNADIISSIRTKQAHNQPIEKDGKINFVGREIPKKKSWHWLDIARLADEETGEQMNWSLYPTLEEAQESNLMQLQRANIGFQHPPEGDFIKLLSDTQEDMYFENIPTKVRKLVYLASMQRGSIQMKYIVYFVAEKIRDKNVACVLSFYEIDGFSEKNLPPMVGNFLRK